LDGTGTAEPIDILGSTAAANCSNITMRAHPAVEVRSTQRCPATLLRTNYLVGDRVVATTPVCGALSFTYEFTQVTSCGDGTVVSVVPSTFSTAAATPYLQLGVLPNLSSVGAWDVRIRPNFAYGAGSFGPTQRINVNGTSASSMMNDEAANELEAMSSVSFELYPNPSTGSWVGLSVSGIESDKVQVRLLDLTGRELISSQYVVEGTLQTNLNVDQLSNGIYIVELMDGATKREQRLVIQQ
jgi:hypothetical protein